FCWVLITRYQRATTATQVEMATRMRWSRFSLESFFMLSHLFREVALQGQHHVRIAGQGAVLGSREAGEQHTVSFLQMVLEKRNIGQGFLKMAHLAARLRAGIDGIDDHVDFFGGGGRFADFAILAFHVFSYYVTLLGLEPHDLDVIQAG